MSTRRRQLARRRREEARALARALLVMLGLFGCVAALSWVGSKGAVAGATDDEAQAGDVDGRAGEAELFGELGTGEAVVIALPQLPRKFDPLDDIEPWAERIGDDLIFEGLVRRSADRYPWVEPALADRCEVDRGGAVMAVSCHVPEGVRFHDGSELSIDDVVYSLRYWLNEQRSWLRQRHGLSSFHRVEIVDGPPGARDHGRWVRLRFSRPEPLALELLSAIKIVPMAAHHRRATRFSQAPIGTGPMRLTTLERDRIVLERFEDYRDPRRRARSRVLVFRAVDDGAAALTALRRGEVHLLPQMAPSHVPVELGKPGMSARLRAWLVSPASYDVLLWNVGKGVSAELGVREALHEAVPYAAIAREIYGGPGLPVWAPVDLHTPTTLDLYALEGIKRGEPMRAGLPSMLPLDRDARGAERGAAALDALGWPLTKRGQRRGPGGALRMTLAWDGHAGRPRSISASIRGAWESIGVRSPDSASSWRFLFSLLWRGDFRVALLHFGGHSDEDLFHMFHSGGSLNFARVADAQLDAALDAYRAATDRRARDLAKQHVARRLADLRVVSVIHAPVHVMLASRRLDGVEFVDDLPRLDTLSLSNEAIDWEQEAQRREAEARARASGICRTCQ